LNQVDTRLQEIARDVFGDESLVLTDSTKPVDVSGWDSLAHVHFMLGVETEFDVEFSEDEFVGFEDIGGLKRILAPKLVNPSVVSDIAGNGHGRAAS
jgi:acyl carrier protein